MKRKVMKRKKKETGKLKTKVQSKWLGIEDKIC